MPFRRCDSDWSRPKVLRTNVSYLRPTINLLIRLYQLELSALWKANYRWRHKLSGCLRRGEILSSSTYVEHETSSQLSVLTVPFRGDGVVPPKESSRSYATTNYLEQKHTAHRVAIDASWFFKTALRRGSFRWIKCGLRQLSRGTSRQMLLSQDERATS